MALKERVPEQLAGLLAASHSELRAAAVFTLGALIQVLLIFIHRGQSNLWSPCDSAQCKLVFAVHHNFPSTLCLLGKHELHTLILHLKQHLLPCNYANTKWYLLLATTLNCCPALGLPWSSLHSECTISSLGC